MIQILLTSLLLTVAQATPDEITVTPPVSSASILQDSESTDVDDSNTTAGSEDDTTSATPDEEAAAASSVSEPTAVSKMISTLDEITQSGAIGLLRKGGLFMYPILLMGIVAAGVIIERYRSLKMLSTDSEELRSRVQELLNADNVEEALQLCHGEQGPVPAILSSGLRKFLVLRRLNYDAGRIEEQVVKSDRKSACRERV
mgnify:FL=1